MRRSGTRRGRSARAVVLVLLAAAVGLPRLPAGASGGASDPPGWSGATPGEWVAFTVSPTTAVPIGRTGTYEPVTITRLDNLTTTPIDSAFGGWPVEDHDGDTLTPDVRGWPTVWTDGNVTLERVAFCAATADECDYRVTSPGPFHFAGGDPPVDGTGQPNYGLFPPSETITAAPAPALNIVFAWDPSTARTPAAGTSPGRLTLDASASSDQFPGTLEFAWTVSTPDDAKVLHATGPVATFDLDRDSVYCVEVTVTNTADGHSQTYGVGKSDCKFVDQVTPQQPGTTPGPGTGGGTAGGGAGGGINVVFAPPRRASSALTGTAGGDSVVWLWRPEYFQPGTETTQALPQTGRNPLEGRTDIVVAADPAPDSNATPMLAGLGIFGVVGVGWLASRRRKLRAEY